MNILLVDNYDSFTFNLYHMLESINGINVRVCKNDEVTDGDLLDADAVVFSPGPGLPSESGRLIEAIRRCLGLQKKMLGVCLGHQALNEAMGGKLFNLAEVMHGVARQVKVVRACPLYRNIPEQFMAGRYHSWGIDERFLSRDLLVTGRGEQGEIMSVHHRFLPAYGVQYHPESVLTPLGNQILLNFVSHGGL